MPPISSLPPAPDLPAHLTRALTIGSNGESRLLELAEGLLESLGDTPDPAQIATFRDMTLAAWECALLSANTARIVSSVHGESPFLRPNVAAFAASCASLRPDDREGPVKINERIQAGDLTAARHLTTLHAAREPGNLFWLYFASFLGIGQGELEWYESWLAAPPMPPEFALAFRAEFAFAREEYAKAAALYAEAFALTDMPEWLVREGESRLRLGERDSAARAWKIALSRRPWQTSLRLRLQDLEREADRPGAAPPGKGEILLYSWNHAPDLDLTLNALHASDLGDAGLTVLDNGSTDTTPAVLAAWRNKFGSRIRTITLPTNIGAPAARNWLLSLEEVKSADWTVFLDDDALVPPDWLGYFGTALRLYPEAGIVGCRVVDKAAPMTVQSVDLFFEQKAVGPGKGKVNETHGHARDPDFGQYSYLRPAISVTGCCHLLTRENIAAMGLFDLRFSPSQMDDLERDIRSCAKGIFPLYQGHLRVRHIKRSGLGVQTTPWHAANCAGNAEKLRMIYSRDTLLGLTEQLIPA